MTTQKFMLVFMLYVPLFLTLLSPVPRSEKQTVHHRMRMICSYSSYKFDSSKQIRSIIALDHLCQSLKNQPDLPLNRDKKIIKLSLITQKR